MPLLRLTFLALVLSVVSAGAQPTRRASFDFTGDGTSDLLFRSSQGAIGFWDVDAGGAINRQLVGTADISWAIQGAGDYNGDGTADLLFRHQVTGAVGYWPIAAGNATGFVPLIWNTSGDWHIVGSLTHTDFNGDGRSDILWRNDSGWLGYYALSGSGPFQFDWVSIGTYDRRWTVVATGDFDGDGRDDVLFRHETTRATAFVRIGSGGATWVDLTPTLGSEWALVAVGDFDGDRTDDVYWVRKDVAGQSDAEGWWNIDAGAVTEFRAVPDQIGTLFLASIQAAGNYFGDGTDDLLQVRSQIRPEPILPNLTATLWNLLAGTVTFNRSLGYFDQPGSWALVPARLSGQLGPPPARRRTVYDFTGDGSSDLLWRNADGQLWFWDFNPSSVTLGGYSENRVVLGTVSLDWDIVGVGDYNGDRTSDILFRNRATGAIGYWAIAQGSMREFVPLRWDLGLEWQVVSSRNRSDLNGDGRDDILLRHVNGALGMYLVTGPGAFQIQWAPLGDLDPAWTVTGTGDFSGDGAEDILVRQVSTGATRYARMSGAGIQAWVDLTASLDAGWYVGALGDFNNDGFTDIYWRTSTTLPEGYWDMASGSVSGFRINQQFAQFPGQPTLGFTSGDYHGDRSEDVAAFFPGDTPTVWNTWWMLGFVTGIDSERNWNTVPAGWTLQ